MARSQPAAEPEVRHIQLEASPEQIGPEAVEVHIRRGRRTRHVRIHVEESCQVTASIPMRFALSRLDPIVRERSEWIRTALARMAERASTAQLDLERGDPIRFLGRWVPVRVERLTGRSRALVELEPDPALGASDESGGDGLTPSADARLMMWIGPEGDPYHALSSWYRREARRILEARVHLWADHFGLKVGAISIRDQRTRWGSCTHRGDLSLNWRLIMAPLWILDSIVVHELCHIDELNHSSRFWALLDQRFPAHQQASDWLREHGSALRMPEPTAPMQSSSPAPAVAATRHAEQSLHPAPEETAPTSRRRRRSRPQPTEQFSLPIE